MENVSVQWSMVDSFCSRTNRWEKVPFLITQLAIYTTYICVIDGMNLAKYYFTNRKYRFPWNSREFLLNHHLGAQNSCEVAIIWPGEWSSVQRSFGWYRCSFQHNLLSQSVSSIKCVFTCHVPIQNPNPYKGGEAYVITKNCTTSRNFYGTDLENLELNDS